MFGSSAVGQSIAERVRHTYQVTGTVTDESSKPLAGMYVCWEAAERPMNARSQCVKTDENGAYQLSTSDIPDKYVVIASTFGRDGMFGRTDESQRSKSSSILDFAALDEVKVVDIRMDAQKNGLSESCAETSIKELQICTNALSFSLFSGLDINLRLFFRNNQREPTAIKLNGLAAEYNIRISNSKGEVLPSKTVPETTSEESDSEEDLPPYFGSGTLAVPAGRDVPIELHLSTFFDLTRKDIYSVAIIPKVSNSHGVENRSLPPVSIEIK